MRVRVSVVVPTYRRPEMLNRCLAALLAQEFDPTAYEVIVVDDAASLQTRRLVESWRGHARLCTNGHVKNGQEEARGPLLRYLPVTGPRHGPAVARNRGWRAAQGEIIAFTDDDCVPEPGWLRAGVASFANGVAGCRGRIVVPLPPEPTDYERNCAALEGGEFVTANCFYRREALEAIGGFDEQFALPWREDSDLFFRLLGCGGTNGQGPHLVEAPEAVVIHPVRPAPWGISLKEQRKSMYNALLYKKHPRLYRERIQPAPPWHYYGTVGTLLLALCALLAGRRRLARGALLAWLGLTARFCHRRLQGTARRPHHVAEMIITSALIPPLAIFWRLRGAIRFRVFFL